MSQFVTEYEVETSAGYLVGVFNWAELKAFFKHVKPDTIKKSYQRGDLLLSAYRLTKVVYDPTDEE